MKKIKIGRIFLIVLAVFFFASVPFAVYYNQQYDRFGAIGREQTPVFITIVSVDADRYVGTFKLAAAQYTKKNDTVKILVMPLKRELLPNMKYSIAVVNETGILHAFISKDLNAQEIEHCTAYLEKLGENESLMLSIKV